MRRREFIAFIGAASAAYPLAVGAQQYARARRIAVLIGVEGDAEGRVRLAAFRNGMHNLGWSEGHDIQVDVRFAAGDADRARAYGAELIGWAPDVILANSSLVVAALKQQTKMIPIVFAQVVDPLSSGFGDSLARPGGNITGFVSLNFGMGANGSKSSNRSHHTWFGWACFETRRHPGEVVSWEPYKQRRRRSGSSWRPSTYAYRLD